MSDQPTDEVMLLVFAFAFAMFITLCVMFPPLLFAVVGGCIIIPLCMGWKKGEKK